MRNRIVLASAAMLAVLAPVVLATWIAIEEAKFSAPLPVAGDQLGHAVALCGDTAVIGVPSDDHAGALTDAGAVLVYVKSGATWTLQARLEATAPATLDRFGVAVAIEGDTLVVGASHHDSGGVSDAGAAYVFTRSGSAWTRAAQLVPSSPGKNQIFGAAVALAGDSVVIGAPGKPWALSIGGQGYVFVRSAGSWSEQDQLGVSFGHEEFGAAVAIEGDRIVIGAPGDDVAYVFSRTGAVWNLDQPLRGRSATPSGAYDRFGTSVDISGETLVVGAPAAWINTGAVLLEDEAGVANVFAYTGTKWSWETGLTRKQPLWGQGLGGSVSIDGDVIVAGATGFPAVGLTTLKSNAFVFVRSGTTWSQQQKIQPLDFQNYDGFGFAVALSGTTLLISSPFDDHPGAANAGSAYVYQVSQPGPVNYCQPGLSASGCAATIGTLGTPSATAPSGFQLTATNVEGARPGLFLYTTSGRKINAWGNGTSLKCLGAPAYRSAVLPGVGTLGACDGSFALDLNAVWCSTCPQPTHNPGEGSGVQAQLWYRDPMSTSNQTTSFSDAVEFWVEP